MIKLTGAILVFFLAAAPTAYAAELCTPMRLEHKRIDDRATVMHFPEDRVVTLIGHDHGDRGDIRRFSTRLQSPDNEQSTDSWEQGVDDFLRENQTALLHATEDLGYLRASLWQAKEPIFVAIEARERKVAAHLDAATLRSRASIATKIGSFACHRLARR